MAKKGMALYDLNPQLYDNYSNLKTDRILTIIGLISNIITILAVIVYRSCFRLGCIARLYCISTKATRNARNLIFLKFQDVKNPLYNISKADFFFIIKKS